MPSASMVSSWKDLMIYNLVRDTSPKTKTIKEQC